MLIKLKTVVASYMFIGLILNPLIASQPSDRISHLRIAEDTFDMYSVGFNDSNMATNGEMQVLSILHSNDTVFDVGANIGEWSALAFLNEANLNCFCFEPIPPIFDILKGNHNLIGVNFSMLALSDIPGEANFYYYPDYPELSTFHRRPVEIEKKLNMEPTVIPVLMQRLDTFAIENDISKINFLKIDTEGHELHVLKGCSSLLKIGAIDMIQFEYGGCYLDSKTTLEEVFDLLTSHGYTLYRIIPEGLIHILTWHPEVV